MKQSFMNSHLNILYKILIVLIYIASLKNKIIELKIY